MFPLFETIAIENGKIKNIALHQARYEHSLITYYGKSAITFFNLLDLIQVPKKLHISLFAVELTTTLIKPKFYTLNIHLKHIVYSSP